MSSSAWDLKFLALCTIRRDWREAKRGWRSRVQKKKEAHTLISFLLVHGYAAKTDLKPFGQLKMEEKELLFSFWEILFGNDIVLIHLFFFFKLYLKHIVKCNI